MYPAQIHLGIRAGASDSWVDAKASVSIPSVATAAVAAPKLLRYQHRQLQSGNHRCGCPEPVAVLSVGNEDIKDFVLSVVSEKTGYPAEMLDLELDLEADLGIDTVKQAELFRHHPHQLRHSRVKRTCACRTTTH